MAGRERQSAFERGIPQSILGGVVGAFFVRLLQAADFLPGGALVWAIGSAIMLVASWGVNRLILAGSARTASSLVLPTGRSTSYTPTYSHIEALEVRGDLAGASRAWAAACTEQPRDPLVHVKAGDFHLRLRKDHRRALELYRRGQGLAGANKELQRYAQSKVIDVLLALGEDGKAMIELRQVIERFPGTRDADEARVALQGLKATRAERPESK